ncbi:MAG: hemerythrin domain-containing protein [Planctomycetia bacterium]|nr:hemerythrin domain-containing protein [Planctomycetia bacterium]
MAIATRTVAINPAFLQEIKDDHHELRQLLHHTAAMLNRPPWMQMEYDRLVDLFTKLRDQLAMHFSLEEAYGYFEDAITVAPHLSKRAEALRSQHFELYSQLCSLVERAEQLLYHEAPAIALAGLAEGFRAFSFRLQDHELCESDLILEAFHDDLGAGD